MANFVFTPGTLYYAKHTSETKFVELKSNIAANIVYKLEISEPTSYSIMSGGEKMRSRYGVLTGHGNTIVKVYRKKGAGQNHDYVAARIYHYMDHHMEGTNGPRALYNRVKGTALCGGHEVVHLYLDAA
ncbi:hypothetical protein Ddc_13906 [Ditylenchus destructor]|nr:hypothetical protein Ddc_13906 [Ditylenchus destructor]